MDRRANNPSVVRAVSAMARVICAVRTLDASAQPQHNPPVAGPSPTRPTSPIRLNKEVE